MTDEETPAEEPKPEEGESGETPAEPQDKVTQAENIVKRMEEANKKAEEIAERMERARAHEIISGRSDAGKESKKKTEKEIEAEQVENTFKEMGLPFTEDS